jgi:hypothetical protein
VPEDTEKNHEKGSFCWEIIYLWTSQMHSTEPVHLVKLFNEMVIYFAKYCVGQPLLFPYTRNVWWAVRFRPYRYTRMLAETVHQNSFYYLRKLINCVEGFLCKRLFGRSQRDLSYRGFWHQVRCIVGPREQLGCSQTQKLNCFTAQWLLYLPPVLPLSDSEFVWFRTMLAINSYHFSKHDKSWCL